MRRVFGPRTAVEAAFLVAVPVVAAALGAGMWTIIAASAVAYLLIFVLEATLWREGAREPGGSRIRIPSRTALVKSTEPTQLPEPESVLVVSGSVESAAATPEPVVSAESAIAPEPVPAEVAAPSFTAVTTEHVRVLRPKPAPEPVREPVLEHVFEPVAEHVLEAVPDPEPEPVPERPQLTAVPEPEPEPEPVPAPVAPEPAPEPSTVVPIGVGAGPRQWSLWDLERLTREHAGGDVAQDEERQFLLMYLREFADSAGLLPLDFDGLVRDSFGELVGAR
jgi:hypothetical protein